MTLLRLFPPLPLVDVQQAMLPDVQAQQALLRQSLPDAQLSVAQEVGRKASHGRFESRTLWVISSAALNAYAGSAGTVGRPWPGLAQVCRIQRVVRRKDRKSGTWRTTQEVRYAVTSLGAKRADAKAIMKRWRIHWHIENRLHWVRDVTFGEDDSAIHRGQAPEVLATLRNGALTLLHWGWFPSIAAGKRDLGADLAGSLRLFGILMEKLRPDGGLCGQMTAAACPAVALPSGQLAPTAMTAASPRAGP